MNWKLDNARLVVGRISVLTPDDERSGWLRRVGPGAYARLSDNVDWTGALFAIQTQLKLPIHVADTSALELKGLGHFVAANKVP